eukprot:m.261603 g.261603  ORF g.261603 m.261603 type:complete len:399 (-) comp42533_c0_seq1:98-1294(-)
MADSDSENLNHTAPVNDDERRFKKKKQVRVWADGCYDMMHFGHANSLRQAKAFGDYLIVGVHSDEDIIRHKGPTVMNEKERYEAVRSCKWVDEVVEGAPYVTDLEFVSKYNCDFVVHGDDITTDEFGNDTYQAVKDAGKYKECKRTPGVSTTDLVGRMLLLHSRPARESAIADAELQTSITSGSISSYTGVSQFIPTSGKIVQFSSLREPKADDTIVYMPGTFDLFNVGHIAALQKARELGTYVICGVLTDQDASHIHGKGKPICNIHERTLGVLQCRYVDEVVIGAPHSLTLEMVKHFKINVVVSGKIQLADTKDGHHPLQVAIDLGIYKQVDSGSKLTTDRLIRRILGNYMEFTARNEKKNLKELRVQQFLESQNASRTTSPTRSPVVSPSRSTRL